MFKKQKTEDNIEKINYEVELSKLSTQVQIKDVEIDSLKKKIELKESELKDLDVRTVKELTNENKKLELQIEKLKFDASNNTENIELKTENAKIRSEIEVVKSENSHLKNLLKTYQEMPDIKKMLDNLSSIAVPNIEELKSFASAMSETEIKELVRVVEENTAATRDVVNRSFHGYR